MNAADKREFKRLHKAKLRAQASGKLKEEAELCNIIGELLSTYGEYDDAIKEHRQELRLFEVQEDIIGAAIANRKIGECYSELGEYQKALEHQRKHLSLAESASNHLEQQRALATVGRTYLCWADNLGTEDAEKVSALQEAQKAFLRSLAVCDDHLKGSVSQSELMEMRARLLLNLGLVYESLGSARNAVQFIKKAIFIAEKHKLLEDLFRCHLSLGDVYQRSGVTSKAGRSLESALMVAKRLKNKELERQCLCASANVFFELGDFPAAKRSLKKAYKLGCQKPEDRESVITTLQAAMRCVQLHDKLQGLSSVDYEGRLPLYEALGDLCCKVASFKKAIEFYKKQLQCAEVLCRSAKELASIYVSLAATYADDSQYRNAIEMYSCELKLRRGNLKEEVKTWLNVADMQEKAGESFDVINESYKRALECARQACHPRLQLRTLKSQLLLIEKHEEEHLLRPTQKMLRHLKEEHDLASDDDEIDDDDSDHKSMEHSEPLSDSLDAQLADLTDSDSGSEEEYDRPSATERVRRNKFSKINEKGESLLHRACIAGNLKQVNKLIEQGHPVNPRDHCGWIPLHEACNYGYYDIVDVLLSHGADINDRGGVGCGGITPLHDAISCGNWRVAKLLIERGANTLAKDDTGSSALDALKSWLDSYSNEIDEDTREECLQVAQMLREGINQDTTEHNKTPLTRSQPQGGLFNSDVFDQEEEESQSQSNQSFRRTSPHLGQGSVHHTLKSYRSGPHRGLRERGVADRKVNVASRRNTALSLGNDDDDDVIEDDCQMHSDGSDNGNHVGQRNSRSRQQSVDSLPDEDFGVTSSSKRTCPDSSMGNDNRGCNSPAASVPEMNVSKRNSRTDQLGHFINDEDDERDVHFELNPPNPNIDQPSEAHQTYQDVMHCVGSAATRLTQDPISSHVDLRTQDSSVPSLIPEQDYTGGDDWLVDDLQHQPSKRRRVDSNLSAGPHFQGTGHWNSAQNSLHTMSLQQRRKSRPKQKKLTSFVQQSSHSRTQTAPVSSSCDYNEDEDDDDDDDNEDDDDSLIADIPTQHNSCTTLGSPSSSWRPSVSNVSREGWREAQPLAPGPSSMMRVQVKIQEKLFLIPVNLRNNCTMQWLSEQAANRYYSQCGLRPKLSLCTSDGALFSPEDSVVDLLNNNEVVIGRVDSWDLPPLGERYKKACQKTKTGENPDILTRLHQCQTQLDLSSLSLRLAVLAPVLSALQCQYSLRKLLLTGNRLGNASASLLAAALESLPNLVKLDLSSNELSSEGLWAVAEVFERSGVATGNSGLIEGGQKPLQFLEELILSYNPLSDACALSLTGIVQHCRLLTTLAIRSCDLSTKLFQLHRQKLVQAFQGADCLHTVLISQNPLGSTGVELLLGCLPRQSLRRLDLSNVITNQSEGIHLARHLSKYFNQAAVLDDLQLSGCHLTDGDIDYIKRLQPHSKHWKNLDLSANPRLTTAGMCELLRSLHHDAAVTKLDFSGCGLDSPLDTHFIDTLTNLLPGPDGQGNGPGLEELRLCGTGLSKLDKELVMNVWNAAHGTRAGHHIDTRRCRFFVNN